MTCDYHHLPNCKNYTKQENYFRLVYISLMKPYLILLFLFTSFHAQSATKQSMFKNTREGISRHLGLWNKFWLDKKNIKLGEDFFTTLSSQEQLCEENYIKNIVHHHNSDEIKYSILSLRKNNLLDDIATALIFDFKKVPFEINIDDLDIEKIKQIKNLNHTQVYQALKQFSTYQKKKQCIGESFTQLYSSLTNSILKKSKRNKSIKQTDKIFKRIIKKLYKKNVITKKTRQNLSKLLKNKIHQRKNNLKNYFQVKSFIEKNIKKENLEDEIKSGTSDFISKKDKINKVYPRSRLYEKYNQFQIIYMAQILDRFLKRLEMTAMLGINLIDENQETFETIYIESPMEIYRFLLKYMRHEMRTLKENHLFSNAQVIYTDLIAASFELYQIPPSSLEELLKVEELWNPQKSKHDKIIMWGKLFTQTGIIFVPPPYNYLATLSIWVIESFFQGNKEEEASFNHSIFGEVQ